MAMLFDQLTRLNAHLARGDKPGVCRLLWGQVAVCEVRDGREITVRDREGRELCYLPPAEGWWDWELVELERAVRAVPLVWPEGWRPRCRIRNAAKEAAGLREIRARVKAQARLCSSGLTPAERTAELARLFPRLTGRAGSGSPEAP